MNDVRSPLFHLILRSVAKRSVSKDGDAKDGAAAFMKCMGTVPVATLRDTPLRSVPQGEVKAKVRAYERDPQPGPDIGAEVVKKQALDEHYCNASQVCSANGSVRRSEV